MRRPTLSRMRGKLIAARAWWNNTARRSASSCSRVSSSPSAGPTLARPPRQPKTSNASRIWSPAENPGMSACWRMYAPCLWKPMCETDMPISCRVAAQPRSCRWLEPGGPGRGDAAAGEAVLLEDLGKRGRGTGRRIGVVPVTRTELLGDRLDFRARGRFRDRERVGGQPPVREESLGHAYAADLERLQPFGPESAPENDLGEPP